MRNVCICGRHNACGAPELFPLAEASFGTLTSTGVLLELDIFVERYQSDKLLKLLKWEVKRVYKRVETKRQVREYKYLRQ